LKLASASIRANKKPAAGFPDAGFAMMSMCP